MNAFACGKSCSSSMKAFEWLARMYKAAPSRRVFRPACTCRMLWCAPPRSAGCCRGATGFCKNIGEDDFTCRRCRRPASAKLVANGTCTGTTIVSCRHCFLLVKSKLDHAPKLYMYEFSGSRGASILTSLWFRSPTRCDCRHCCRSSTTTAFH